MSGCCCGGCRGVWEVGYFVLLLESRYGVLISDRLRTLADGWMNAALIGTVEELGVSSRTQTLVREQFETNFFGPVNVIKAALPAMRKRCAGHIMILTGIS